MQMLKNRWVQAFIVIGGSSGLMYLLASEKPRTIQEWNWIIASCGGIFTALKSLEDWEHSREQSVREHKWKRGKLAMKVIDSMKADAWAASAMRMIDWTDREYENPLTKKKHQISYEQLSAALRSHSPEPGKIDRFEDHEVFVRDCFDGFFDHLERIQYLIDIELIDPADVRSPLKYWADAIVQGKVAQPEDALRKFMTRYGYSGALKLVNTFAQSNKATLGEGLVEPNHPLQPTAAKRKSNSRGD